MCLAQFRATGVADSAKHWVEPSAGRGAFYKLLPSHARTGIDLDPRYEGVERADFLEWECTIGPSADVVVIGNPPFGKRGELAARFMNKAMSIADTVGMILPCCFLRYDGQRRINPAARLIRSTPISRDAFVLPNGERYDVQTVFQVWTMRNDIGDDMRQTAPLPTHHEDFDLWQYNNTAAAVKVFDNPFDFAVPCQGRQDYTRRETDRERCELTKQWMLINPKTERAREVLLYCIDYEELAYSSQTRTPGFRKGTLVRAYEEAI